MSRASLEQSRCGSFPSSSIIYLILCKTNSLLGTDSDDSAHFTKEVKGTSFVPSLKDFNTKVRFPSTFCSCFSIGEMNLQVFS